MTESLEELLAGVREMLLNLRHEAKLTQKQAAAGMGISSARVSEIESGHFGDMKISTIKKFADFYGQELWIFITPPEEETSEASKNGQQAG